MRREAKRRIAISRIAVLLASLIASVGFSHHLQAVGSSFPDPTTGRVADAGMWRLKGFAAPL